MGHAKQSRAEAKDSTPRPGPGGVKVRAHMRACICCSTTCILKVYLTLPSQFVGNLHDHLEVGQAEALWES